jgi:hypothetical protein
MGANIKVRKASYDDKKKTSFLALVPGSRVIRILDKDAKDIFTHWINKANVVCLNEDGGLEGECPICANNQRLMFTYRENKEYRNAKGWSPSRQMFLVNVLDRTKIKVCPNEECNAEVLDVVGSDGKRVFPTVCPECGASLVSVEAMPLNKVKVLSRGVSLFNDLNMIEETVLDEDGNKIGWTNYDIRIVTTGTDKESKHTAVPLVNRNDKVDIKDEDKFDLDNVVLKLTVNEMLELQRGVSIKDIFQARNSSSTTPDVEKIAKEVSDKVTNTIKNLFPDDVD